MDERAGSFLKLLKIMDELREQCPWDKKQTIESIRHLTIEETFELSDAILKNDLQEIKKELVIQKDEKECTYNLPKGIYTYEVLLSSKDTYQKGEYKVTEETLMTVNKK